eukprot:4918018-Amphidinium_carterae.1
MGSNGCQYDTTTRRITTTASTTTVITNTIINKSSRSSNSSSGGKTQTWLLFAKCQCSARDSSAFSVCSNYCHALMHGAPLAQWHKKTSRVVLALGCVHRLCCSQSQGAARPTLVRPELDLR